MSTMVSRANQARRSAHHSPVPMAGCGITPVGYKDTAMMTTGTICHRYTVMTVAFRRVTRRHRRALRSSRDTTGSAASTSPHCAAANASSATDGGVVLATRSPAPIMSTGKGPQVSRAASATMPQPASA
jgi:hypothetical protein